VSAGPSLYRRHRPRSFAEVVGQEHVVRTLSNAVQREMVHHAYLFVGSRGTGKTSMAKILAASLNCERGPTIEPCGACESCTSIATATSLDVIEMDAASSNSVDDIRALRESVAYAPVSGRQKVYILDEAHMLSTAAWNAFLKTLEEPPPHTIFVLATTEAQKVLPTVVDRCHRFDFQRPTVEQIATVLRRVAQAEGIVIPEEATGQIARHASGSFRDALGTLEQLRTYGGNEIALGDVLAVLGVTDSELLFGALDAVAAGDARAALLAVASCVEGGRDPAGFVRELETHARELLVVQTLGGTVPAEISVTLERDERLVEQAARVSAAALVALIGLLADALAALRNGADGRTQLELALVKAAQPALDASSQALLQRIERLEGALGETRSPAGPPPAAAKPQPAAQPPPKPREQPSQARGDAVHAAAALATATALAPSPDPDPEPALEPEPEQTLTLERLLAIWPAALQVVGESNKMLAAVIADAQPVELDGHRLVLAFPSDAAFLQRKADDRTNRAVVVDAIKAVSGHSLTLSYELRELAQPAAADPLSQDEWAARLKAEFDAEELAQTQEDQ
jgi:DNA polymerase-3 subunit gamma/tau